MSDNDKGVPEEGQTSEKQTGPESSDEGQPEKVTAEAPSNKIPDNLKDLSQGDLIKMYGELERKLGEQSQTVAEAKKIRENQQLLAEAIYGDQELHERLEKRLKKVMGYETEEDSKEKKESGDGEDPKLADLRRSHENRIISEFSSKYGLDQMNSDERQKVMKKVGAQLADLVDPTGKKNMNQVLEAISLEKLPNLLEKSFYLANMESITSGGEALNGAQNLASIGRVSSSSVKGGPSESLSERESLIAKKLGLNPDDYLQEKKKMSESSK